jgi:hypothetical protein
MKLRLSLFALIIAFPLLYIAGAMLQSELASAVVLIFVAGLCFYLLKPEAKV